MSLTVESLTLEVGKALAPLERRLRGGEIALLFAEIGLPAADVVLGRQAVGAAIEGAATALSGLPRTLADLEAAVAARDAGQIAQALAAAASILKAVIAAVEVVSDAIQAAAGSAGPGQAEVSAFAAEFAQRLLGFALATYLEEQHPVAGHLLGLIGVIESTQLAATPVTPAHTRRLLRVDRITQLLRDPVGLLGELYRWGSADFDWGLLLRRLSVFLSSVTDFAFLQSNPDPQGLPILRILGVDIERTTDAIPGIQAVLRVATGDKLDLNVPLSDTVAFVVTGDAQLAASAAVQLLPAAQLRVVPPAGQVHGGVRLGLELSPTVFLGTASGSRVEARTVRATAGADLEFNTATQRADGQLVLELAVEGGKVVLNLEDADGFLGAILPSGTIELDLDFALSWSSATGLHFKGNAGAEVELPVDFSVGPVKVNGLHLGLLLGGDSASLELSTQLAAQLGPITAAVDRLGARLKLTQPPGGGTIGAADLSLEFKPPTGVGLSIGTASLSGGGFLRFDSERGEYSGALELQLADFLQVKAIGLISTRQPDGSPGFSLLIVLTAEFGTGIQLGLGFTLLAVGGLVGLNRAMNLQALVEGVRTGSIESVAFPRDVIANAPRILSDLNRFFPARQGTFLIGPMAKIGWGTPTLISISLGVIIEIPGNLAVLGVLRAALPNADKPLLVIQAQFVGALEPGKSRLWFFAKLFDSRVLTMALEGGMGVLVAWGDNPDLVVTVGGFHPGFRPPPLPFPVPARITVDLLNRRNQLIRIAGYFAITSNTAQFGAKAELRLGFSSFGIEGHLGFDALFQFSPFRFAVHISADVTLKAFGVGAFTIDLDFQLDGPAPWRAHGKGSIGFLFFSISADFDITWGEQRDTTLPPVQALVLLADEFGKPENWETRLPTGGNRALVNLRALPPGGAEPVLHPLGTLFVRQRALPLGVRLDRVGAQRVSDARRFTVAPVPNSGLTAASVTPDKFAMAQYQTMSDQAKLSRPSFETQDAGLELTAEAAAMASARVVRRSARYELHIIDSAAAASPGFARASVAVARKRFHSVSPAVFGDLLQGSSTSRAPLSDRRAKQKQPFGSAETVQVAEARFAVAYLKSNRQAFPPGGLGRTSRAAAATFRSLATAQDALADFVSTDPSLAGKLHVIPASEVTSPPAQPGTWTEAGALPVPVSDVDIVALASGLVLLAGGTDPSGVPVSATALFDPTADSWTPGPALNVARHRHSTTRLADGRVLVAGGQGADGNPLASAELFDPAAGAWRILPSLATARYGHSATVLADGSVLIAGGTATGALIAAELFHPATGTWTATDPMTDARSGHEAVRLDDGRVLLVGGSLPLGGKRFAALTYCEVYDPAGGGWAPTGSLAQPRAGHRATRLPNGRILVTGGEPVVAPDGTVDPHSLDTTEVFDPATGIWTPAAPMPAGGRSGHHALPLRSGAVLVTGGTSAPEHTAGHRGALLFDPKANAWNAIDVHALVHGRTGHAATELSDDRVLVAAGMAAAGTAAGQPDAADPAAISEVLIP